MSLNNKKKRCFQFLICFCLSVVSVSVNASKQLKNEGFSDPDKLVNVPQSFIDKNIEYDEKVGSDVDVVISLGQQTYPAIHEFVQKVANDNGIKIVIQQGTCGATARKLRKKNIDIGTYCCPPGATDRLPGLKFNTVAIAPLTLIAHKDNPLEDLSIDDARKIYKGKYVGWSEVPGVTDLADKLMGERIQPVVRLHCKKKPGHWQALIKDHDELSPRAESVATIPEMIERVANNELSIGYETPYMVEVHENKGELKMLSINGMKANDLEHLLKGDYPLYRTYSMTTWTGENNRNEKAEILMEAIYQFFNEQGEKYGFVSAERLKQAGWKFKDRELIAEPDNQVIITRH